jgi:hypothetical protein
MPGGYATDVVTRAVNVQWGGGLAVEFTHRPDYLAMKRALSMNKVVISFWFRIPSETVSHVRETAPSALPGGGFWGHRVFLTVIPLIVWGEQQTTTVTDFEAHDTGAVDVSGSSIIVQRETGSHLEAVQPSCIGVRVGVTGNPWEPPVLDIHIQTGVHATGSNLRFVPTDFTGTFMGISATPGDPSFGKPIFAHVEYVMTDYTDTVTAEPEYLGNSESTFSGRNTGHPEIKPDQWHHLLMSWELVSHTTTGGTCKMWCAIDNNNKAGDDLPAINDSASDMGPNDHVTYTIWSYLGNDDASAGVIFETDNVPSNPFRIPAPPSAQYATDASGGKATFNPIEKVELAELQIFSGVTLDTAKETNRQAFIDFTRDSNGNPIVDQDGKRTLKPVNPAVAEQLFGKKPEILLHGSTNWRHGKNTGSLGFNAAGEEVPDGQFVPIGEIKQYTPDPGIVVG